MPVIAPAGCRILEWDSEFFGRRIARVEPSALAGPEAAAVAEWCTSERVECAYLVINPDDQAAIDAAHAQDFTLVDVRVTLEAVGAPDVAVVAKPAGTIVRQAETSDVVTLKNIATESHRDTRFYVDGHFARERCDALYALWIGKSCAGWADRVVVAELAGRPVGYVTCHKRTGEGEIGLVGVAAASRGRGAGFAMIAEARRWFACEGLERVAVATQARNTAALRFYQKAGFTVRSIHLWHHKWF